MFPQAVSRFCAQYGIWIILTLFAFAGMIGLTYHFGFPIAVNDESPPMAAALKMIAEHSLRANYPSFYYMPLSAYFVLPFMVAALPFVYLFGDIHSVVELQRFVILDFAKLLPAARLGSVFYGLLCVWLLYCTVEVLYKSRRLSILAAWFFATSLMLVQLSHIARVWTMEMLMMLVTLFFAARIWKSEQGSMKDYLGAAMGAAFAFGVNVIGLVVFVALLVVHVLKAGKAHWLRSLFDRRLIAASVLVVLSVPFMYFLNPYGFGNFLNYANKFVHVVSPVAIEAAPSSLATSSAGDGIAYYLGILLEYDPLLVIFALAGIFLFFYTSRKTFAWLLVYEVTYFAVATTLSFTHTVAFEPRYALPLYPVFAIAAAFGFQELWMRIKKLEYRYIFSGVVIICSLAVPLLWLSRATLPASRVLALDWVKMHIPAGSRVISTDDRIPLPENLPAILSVASSTPQYMTKKRSWLLTHPDLIEQPAFAVTTMSYFSSSSSVFMGKNYQYALVSWWTPEDREIRLRELALYVTEGKLLHLVRIPGDASDMTRSLDLVNNMRFPAKELWFLRQNGPVVDVYVVVRK